MAARTGLLRSCWMVTALLLALIGSERWARARGCPMVQDPNWAPKSPTELAQLAHVALLGLVERAPGELARRRLESYTATVRVLDVLKGEDTFRRVQRSRRLPQTLAASGPARSFPPLQLLQTAVQPDDWVFNVSNYGSRQLCMSEVLAGHLYVLFLTCKPECYLNNVPLSFSAQYHDVFGAAVEYEPAVYEHLVGALGFARWPLLSHCSASCLAEPPQPQPQAPIRSSHARQATGAPRAQALGTLTRSHVCSKQVNNGVCSSRDPNFDSLRACNRFSCSGEFTQAKIGAKINQTSDLL